MFHVHALNTPTIRPVFSDCMKKINQLFAVCKKYLDTKKIKVKGWEKTNSTATHEHRLNTS